VTTQPAAGFAEAVPALAAEAVRAALRGTDVDAQVLLDAVAAADVRPRLRRPGASFVTLQCHERLRGCIGSLLARRPLYTDIVHNAQKSLRDPRMPAVTPREWPQLSISVAILTQPQPLDAGDLDQLCARLRPGLDGLTLRDGLRRATFLPSVWQSLPQPERFVEALLRKGGWRTDQWPPGMTAQRYGTHSYSSVPPRPALEET
jgi:AmmeMemoRadiSam system protein A